MQEFLTYLVTPLLSVPEKLKITEQGNALIIKVDDTDVGRVIGKHGNVINALRTLCRTFCTTNRQPFLNISIDSPAKKESAPVEE